MGTDKKDVAKVDIHKRMVPRPDPDEDSEATVKTIIPNADEPEEAPTKPINKPD